MLADDPRYDTVRKRAEHAAEIVPQLHAALAAHTALEWEALFGDDVPCAAARRVEDMFDHPQVLAEEMIGTIEHPRDRPLSRRHAADQVRPHAGAGAVRGADAGPGFRRGGARCRDHA